MTTRQYFNSLSGLALTCAAVLVPGAAMAATEVQAYDAGQDAGPGGEYDAAYEPAYDIEPVVVEQLTAAQLETLIGPVALYPDDLLAVVLPASTFPLQIVQAARLLEALDADPDLKPDPEWDESVVALLNYPEVIELMNEDLDWTYALGDAVVTQQTDVIAAIETFRDRAWDAGNLRSDEHVAVVREEEVIRITPVEEEVVYVPYYEPERVVVVQPAPVVHYYPRPYPLYYYPYPDRYAFNTGFFFGVSTAYQIGWGSRFVHLHRNSYASHPFYGRSYLPRYYYHERFHRPGRAAFSRGRYAAQRDRGWRAGRAYRGDRWQAGPRNGVRLRAERRADRRADRRAGSRADTRTMTRGAFRDRDANIVRTTPRDTRRDLRARRDTARTQRGARVDGRSRSVQDAALRGRTSRAAVERPDPRDRSGDAQRSRRNAAPTAALNQRSGRSSRSARQPATSGQRTDRRTATVRSVRERRAALAGSAGDRRANATSAGERRTAQGAPQRAERRQAERRASTTASMRRAAQAERRAARTSESRRTVRQDRRAAATERASQTRRSAQRERRAATPPQAPRAARSAAQRSASAPRAARSERSERSSSRKAERSSRRSEARAEKRSRSRSGGDASRRSQKTKRDRR